MSGLFQVIAVVKRWLQLAARLFSNDEDLSTVQTFPWSRVNERYPIFSYWQQWFANV